MRIKTTFLCLWVVSVMFMSYRNTIYAQPVIQWQLSLGDTADDVALGAQQTWDSGYIIVGYNGCNNGNVTANHGFADYWVVKLSPSGNLIWQKSLGGSNADYGESIMQTFDGGFIVAGTTGSSDGDVTGFHGLYDYWVVKLDDTGGVQWQKTYGGSDDDELWQIVQTTDSGYIMTGYSYSTDGDITSPHGDYDAWIVKISNTGSIQWQRSLGGSGHDDLTSIRQTYDGGYIVTGFSNSADGDLTLNHGGYDYWVVKLSDTGSIQWQKSYGGSGADKGWSVQQTPDSGYIVLGSSNSADGDVTGNIGGYDYWVVKLSDTGRIKWQKSYGGSGDDEAGTVHVTADGSYLIDGSSNSVDGDITNTFGDYDYWEIKLSDTGRIVWQASLGGSAADLDGCMLRTFDGSYFAAGASMSNDFDVTGNHGGYDYWVVKFAPDTVTSVSNINGPAAISVFPNPAITQLNIVAGKTINEVTLIDLSGRLQYKQCFNDSHVDVDVSYLPAGMYFIEVFGENKLLLARSKVLIE